MGVGRAFRLSVCIIIFSPLFLARDVHSYRAMLQVLSCVHRAQPLATWGNGVQNESDRLSLPMELKNHWAREKGLPPHGSSTREAAGSGQSLRQTVPTQYGELWNVLMSFPGIRLTF